MRVEEGDMDAVLRYIKKEQAKEKKRALEAKKKLESAAAAALEKERLREEKANLKNRKKAAMDNDIRFSAEKSLRAKRRDMDGTKRGNDRDKEESMKAKQDKFDKTARFGDDSDEDGEDKDKKKVKSAEDDEIDADSDDDINDDPGLEDFKNYVHIEMSAGWIMIPIKETLQKAKPGKSTKITLDMNGGAPFSLVGIQRSDVPTRKGLLETVKRFIGIKINSKLELSITPVAAPVAKKNQPPPVSKTAILPRDIILPTKTVDIITIYRQAISSEINQRQRYQHHYNSINKSMALPSGNAVFSSFPRILNDPAAQRVLLLLWRLKTASMPAAKRAKSTPQLIDPNYVPQEMFVLFNEVVLKIWHAMSCYNDKRTRLDVDESLDSIFGREMHLRKLVGIVPQSELPKKKSSKDINKTNQNTSTMQQTFDNNNPNIQRTGNFAMQTTAVGKKGKNKDDVNADVLDDDDLPKHDFKPFNVKELLWGIEQDILL